MSDSNKRRNGTVGTRASSAITAVAAGTDVTGTAVSTSNMANDGAMFAEIAMGVKTSSLTMTPSFDVSVDNSTWLPYKQTNNAANVATAAGTGSLVTTTVVIALPNAKAWPYVRAKITTAGATAHATDDVLAIKYHWFAA